MNPLESALYILVVVMGFMMASRGTVKKPYGPGVLSLAILVLTLHIVFGSVRWQLYPLYAALGVTGGFVYLKAIKRIAIHNAAKLGLIIGLSVFFTLSLVSALAFPLYDLPTPGGTHSIGTASFEIEDQERLEQYGEATGAFRTFKVQAWYPAETIKGYDHAPWIEDGKEVSRALARDIGLPFFTLDHTANTLSHAYQEAPISEAADTYPVVILSHGWRGFRNLHTDYAEELASRGYIVFSIDHAYGSVATVLSDETHYLDPSALPPRETTPDFLEHANQLVYTYAGDIEATLDHLEAMGPGDYVFSEALDLTAIGLLGHSTGGGADVALALEDERITAVIGLDAWVESIDATVLENGLTKPSLFLRSGDWEESYNNDALYTLLENSSAPTALYQIDGTTHSDFAMVYMYSPLTKYIGFSGALESEQLTPMLKSMITDFFEETLKNEPDHVIDPETWEEVRRIQVE